MDNDNLRHFKAYDNFSIVKKCSQKYHMIFCYNDVKF
jgi:hypothetical protein